MALGKIMAIYGETTVDYEVGKSGYFVKAVFNRSQIAFFDASIQHRDYKVGTISYEDDYEGNALACVIQNGNIEVRFHSDYSDDDVLKMLETFLEDRKLRKIKWFNITYQGRVLRDYTNY